MYTLTVKMENEKSYFAVYDKEDTYNEGECLDSFDTEHEARDFVINENSGYGYQKLYYIEETLKGEDTNFK